MALLHAPPREQKNWLTPRRTPYQFSNEKRTFHYLLREEVKSRKGNHIARRSSYPTGSLVVGATERF
jgi:hypothetical protein